MSEKSELKLPAGKFLSFGPIELWVGNAKQAASYYITRFGFEPFAYKGLETGSKEIVTHVVKQNNIYFSFSSALKPNNKLLGDHLVKHGDGVRDISFIVSDVDSIYKAAVAKGAKSILKPTTVKDEDGTIIYATLQTYGETTHTLIDNSKYKGFFPGFKKETKEDPFVKLVKPTLLQHVDHCVGNQGWDEMVKVADWYKDKLGFVRFWSVDDKQVHTEFSALRSIVMSDVDYKVKMPINEPAKGKKMSQIEEYVNYYGGPGCQHIALRTDDILTSVSRLRERGVEFLTIPSTYYKNLRKRLEDSSIKVEEDLKIIEKFNILVDFDENGYLLQIFTKPVEDRPTLFYEIIQRRNNDGFGIGNFKALFQSIEEEQFKRGSV